MKARGLSLIEVVASLVLVGTTVTALLEAHGRSLDQLHAIRTQQSASSLARELINQWKLDPAAGRLAVEDTFPSRSGWRWTRIALPFGSASQVELQEVTLRIYQTDGQGREKLVTSYTWLEKLDGS
jgi:Tfp pilus assembly protein PilV